MHERVQIEAAAAIARQERAPPGPEVPAVGPILGEIRSAWILALHLQHDKVETSPQLTVCVHEPSIAEPGACAGGPFENPITVRPHFSDDLLDLRDPNLVLLCKVQPYSDTMFQPLVFSDFTNLFSRPRCILHAFLSCGCTLRDSMVRPNISLTSASVSRM